MIDLNRVQQLRSEIGEDDFREVADLFFAEIDEVVCRLAHSPDPAGLEADLHFIKSSALNLGLSRLSNLCRQGERAAAAGREKNVDLGPILTAYRDSKSAFARLTG